MKNRLINYVESIINKNLVKLIARLKLYYLPSMAFYWNYKQPINGRNWQSCYSLDTNTAHNIYLNTASHHIINNLEYSIKHLYTKTDLEHCCQRQEDKSEYASFTDLTKITQSSRVDYLLTSEDLWRCSEDLSQTS